jgi:hypothetical protein
MAIAESGVYEMSRFVVVPQDLHVEDSFSQFHQHFKHAFYLRKFVQSQTLSREKLLNLLSYIKCARKMLMKLTPPYLLILVTPAAFK